MAVKELLVEQTEANIATLVELRDNHKSPPTVRKDCAITLYEMLYGRPGQAIALGVLGGEGSGEGLSLLLQAARAENARQLLNAPYTAELRAEPLPPDLVAEPVADLPGELPAAPQPAPAKPKGSGMPAAFAEAMAARKPRIVGEDSHTTVLEPGRAAVHLPKETQQPPEIVTLTRLPGGGIRRA